MEDISMQSSSSTEKFQKMEWLENELQVYAHDPWHRKPNFS